MKNTVIKIGEKHSNIVLEYDYINSLRSKK
jgi:hypothetical protein